MSESRWPRRRTEVLTQTFRSHPLHPDQFPDVYNDMFLKRYLTALLKRQWGINLKKFDGMELPGGVTLNGQQMYDEASEEIQRIEEEMQLKYENPPDFFVG